MSTKKEETRTRLFEAARKLLVERGYHGVSLEDIAAAAGVSRQAVYKTHFASKADLLLGLVQWVHVAENLSELIEPAHRARDGVEMLHETTRAIVRIETRLHDLALMLSTAAASDADAAAAWRGRLEVKRGALRAALERVHGEGRLNPAWSVDEAIDLLSVLISVDAYHKLVIEGGWTEAAMIARVRELCATALLIEPVC